MTAFEKLSPNARTILRLAAALALTLVSGFATLALLFVGAVELTGCLIECSEPNPTGGSLLLAGGVGAASATVGPHAWGAIGWKPPVLRRVTGITGALAGILVLAWVFVV